MNQNEMIAYLIIGVVVIGIIIFVVMKMSSGSGSGDGSGSGSGSSATPPPNFFDTTTTATAAATQAATQPPFIPPGTQPSQGGVNLGSTVNLPYQQYIGGPQGTYLTNGVSTLAIYNGQLALNYKGNNTPITNYPANNNSAYLATVVNQGGSAYSLVVYDILGNILYKSAPTVFNNPVVAITPFEKDGNVYQSAFITNSGTSQIISGVTYAFPLVSVPA